MRSMGMGTAIVYVRLNLTSRARHTVQYADAAMDQTEYADAILKWVRWKTPGGNPVPTTARAGRRGPAAAAAVDRCGRGGRPLVGRARPTTLGAERGRVRHGAANTSLTTARIPPGEKTQRTRLAPTKCTTQCPLKRLHRPPSSPPPPALAPPPQNTFGSSFHGTLAAYAS